LSLTLNNREINTRIARWALELENFDYDVDALSSISNILVLEENTLEQNLSMCQNKDSAIHEIRQRLEKEESNAFEMRNGLFYRKFKGNILFYVPANIEGNILTLYHDNMGHRGYEKVYNAIIRSYWFPKLSDKIKQHIHNCLRCITFSSKCGKREGLLHSIPKGDKPFDIVHIDHFGPVKIINGSNKYVLLAVDGFSKFVKLYGTKSTNSKSATKYLSNFFTSYSRPKVIVSNRGTAFTSKDFKEFLKLPVL